MQFGGNWGKLKEMAQLAQIEQLAQRNNCHRRNVLKNVIDVTIDKAGQV